MKASITDRDAIGSLRPLSIIGYLRAKGWKKYNERDGRFSVWLNDQYPDSQVVVPARRDASDFLIQLSQVLRELEEAEGRSQFDIIRDLLNSGFDVIRLGAKSPNTADGSVRIADGVKLFTHAREILLAAACAAVRPSAVFHSRKPQQAVEYMNSARLGQTEHGSYVLTILSPVAPQLNAYSDTQLFPEEPFERQVVKTLTSAVGLAVSAAESAATATNPDFAPFQHAVSGGVSANLCEALSGFFSVGDTNEIILSVAWAQNRPIPDDSAAPSRVLISSDVVPTIEEAARIFRAKDSLDSYLIEGPVVKLERSENSSTGQVTILAPIEDAMRKVVVTLDGKEYDKATSAHQNYRFVKLIGSVKRDGRSFRLLEPGSLELAEEEAIN